jgi:tRNA pseudouridine38-40 synthase
MASTGARLRTVRLLLSYDGTGFVGWQRQAAGESVQGLLEDALAKIEGRAVTVHGAGRTDAGVHALGQVASFRLSSPIEDWQLWRALNAHLPGAIRVMELATVADDFHARFSASSKAYEYRIWNARVQPPFVRPYSWHVIDRLDLAAMQEAARAIVGCHDFKGFRSARSVNHTTVREITSAGWRRGDDALLVFDIAGKGFLRYMVRSLVGTLVEIGRGHRSADEMARLLAAPDRSAAGKTAPALGLFLVKVDY